MSWANAVAVKTALSPKSWIRELDFGQQLFAHFSGGIGGYAKRRSLSTILCDISNPGVSFRFCHYSSDLLAIASAGMAGCVPHR